MPERIPKPIVIALCGIALLLIGIAVGWYLKDRTILDYHSYREFNSDHSLIAPLLFVETPEEQSFPRYSDLKQALAAYAGSAEDRGDVEEVSVYYRNLNTSQWIGTNAEERFSPASMLKVVVLIAVLRMSQDDPSLLGKTVRATGVESIAADQVNYAPKSPMVSGKLYTVEELLEKLIIESDNTANQTLYRIVGEERAMKVYDDLNLHRPLEEDSGYTTLEYSRLFRSLYNSTYLSREKSEYALKLLSRASFTQGLVSGVPAGTTVAHKFGVRTVTNERGTESKELHDCGIVYYPEQPYFLCVMTRGQDFETLEGVIADLSRIAWKEVEELR